jgi:hypothetical protein
MKNEQLKRYFERQKLIELLKFSLPEPQMNNPNYRAAARNLMINIEVDKVMKERYGAQL